MLSTDEDDMEQNTEDEMDVGMAKKDAEGADPEYDAAAMEEKERLAAAKAALEMVKQSVLGSKELPVVAESAVTDADPELQQSNVAATTIRGNAGKEPEAKKPRVAKFQVKRGAKIRTSPRATSGRTFKP